MNILLINPPFLPKQGKFSREQRSPAVTKSGTFYYPMWLAYATGFLEHEGHNCRLIDAPALGCELQPLLEEHINGFTPDLIICDTSTPSISNDVKVAGYLKDHFGGPFTVLVGTHPSALPEDVLKMDERIDAVLA